MSGQERNRQSQQSNSLMTFEVLGIVPVSGIDDEFRDPALPTVGDLSLLDLTFEAVMASRRLNRVIISTDSEAIAAEARRWGLEVPFLRPENMRRSSMAEVLFHSVEHLKHTEGYCPDWVARFLITYPFRSADLIDRTINSALGQDVDSVFLAFPEYHSFWKLNEQGQPERLQTDWRVPRETRQPIYRHLGGLCSLHRVSVLEQGRLYGQKVGVIPIDNPVCTIDIHDWQGKFLAELVARHYWSRREDN